jgi:hypothetical protein
MFGISFFTLLTHTFQPRSGPPSARGHVVKHGAGFLSQGYSPWTRRKEEV